MNTLSENKKVLIVEDEALIADNLAEIIDNLNFSVTDICESADKALKSIKNNPPDICLLDVNIEGEIDGIDLAGLIKSKSQIPHIFLTSYTDEETIQRARETSPSAYLIKPYTEKEVGVNLNLALHKQNKVKSTSTAKDKDTDSFFIKEKHELKKIKALDIKYCEAAEHYTLLHTANGKHMIGQSISKVFEKIAALGFSRVHRSFVVNVDEIESIGPNYVIVHGKELPLSQNNRQDLLGKINLL